MSSIGGVVSLLLCHGWSDTGGCMDGSVGLEYQACFSVEQHEGCFGEK